MTLEQAALDLWRLKPLPKRLFIPRAVAILRRFIVERRAAA